MSGTFLGSSKVVSAHVAAVLLDSIKDSTFGHAFERPFAAFITVRFVVVGLLDCVGELCKCGS